jgi:citrate synthase
MSDKAILTLDGTQYELPVVVGTEGERAIDIRDLRARTGHITLDPGYGNTGSCESAITFIDGERGILRYRGIPIEQLANGPTFVEVAWLLIFGELPSDEETRQFSAELTAQANLDEGMKHHYSGIILRAMGIPTNMFTVIFAIGRLPGWIAHWWEQNQTLANKIARPRQIYVGHTERAPVSLEQRD